MSTPAPTIVGKWKTTYSTHTNRAQTRHADTIKLKSTKHPIREGQKDKKQWFAYFVDIKSAFDQVPRGRLWAQLEEWDIPRDLLRAITSLYIETWAQVKIGNGSCVTNKIATVNGLKHRMCTFPKSVQLISCRPCRSLPQKTATPQSSLQRN